jgi:hypothetical protein
MLRASVGFIRKSERSSERPYKDRPHLTLGVPLPDTIRSGGVWRMQARYFRLSARQTIERVVGVHDLLAGNEVRTFLAQWRIRTRVSTDSPYVKAEQLARSASGLPARSLEF